LRKPKLNHKNNNNSISNNNKPFIVVDDQEEAAVVADHPEDEEGEMAEGALKEAVAVVVEEVEVEVLAEGTAGGGQVAVKLHRLPSCFSCLVVIHTIYAK
jgi:hypothetical protein